MKKLVGLALALLTTSNIYAHGVISTSQYPPEERNIQFPDTEHFKTLVFDPHTHSTFSDGHVWPSVRVAEELRLRLGLRIDVRGVPLGSLPRPEGKGRRFVDRR